MQDKRRWLPRWQRVELVELCLKQGLTRRQAAAWRHVSVATVQYWVDRYRQAADGDRASGRGLMIARRRRTISPAGSATTCMPGSARRGRARVGGRG
jgi:hypothetical protein